ncbi:MAG: hypothetical protein SFU55_00395 [Methylophilus sp.]|nr:hypothetical protein [Methylophilus sp.]
MCISNEMMTEIKSTLTQFGKATNNPVPILKDCFPDLTFLRMSDSDMGEPPFLSLQDYNLYLLDGREHCVQITHNLEHATGVVITQKNT